jgi:hypothetical protein
MQLPANHPGKRRLDLIMAGNGGFHTRSRVDPDIVTGAVTPEMAAVRTKMAFELSPFHEMSLRRIMPARLRASTSALATRLPTP